MSWVVVPPASMAMIVGASSDGIVPIVAIPVAVATVAIVSVAVSYFVINQGSILVLTELADQLGFQS